MKKRYHWEKAALLALCLALLSGVWAEGRQAALAQKVLRLHVLAVSDEAEEQALKLRVRDTVLELVQPLLRGAESAAEAEAILSGHLCDVQHAAEKAAEGRSVSVTLTSGRLRPARRAIQGAARRARRGARAQLVVRRVPHALPARRRGRAARCAGAGGLRLSERGGGL